MNAPNGDAMTDLEELKTRRKAWANEKSHMIAAYDETLADIDKQIAEAEKPRFKVGDEVFLRGKVIETDKSDIPYKVSVQTDAWVEDWVRKSDIVPIPVPPPLTAERIEAALREISVGYSKTMDSSKYLYRDELAKLLAEKLGAATDAEKLVAP
jgi:hypothetical protein